MALSLVDDADIVEAIEAARLVQQVMPLGEDPASELDALVSSAMGLETVRAELNPAETEAPAEDQDEQPSSPYGSLSSQQISHALLRDFLFRGGHVQASQTPSAAYYAGVERELAQLQGRTRHNLDSGPRAVMPTGYREMQPVDRPALPVGVRSTLSSEVWGPYGDLHERSLIRSRLRKDATQVAQVLGMELVREVVNQVAQDPRLLAPLREAIVALEPSLLRLAMVDPRFFSDERHPGRLLMGACGPAQFPIQRRVQRRVHRVLRGGLPRIHRPQPAEDRQHPTVRIGPGPTGGGLGAPGQR